MNEDLLRNNVKTFLNSAELVYDTKDFTSATILYFKALFTAIDLILLKSKGRIPKDHSERFRILELFEPALYSLLDKIYPTYRSTYTATINKETCNKIKENVKRIIKEQKILENN